jgi:hypothetical protein
VSESPLFISGDSTVSGDTAPRGEAENDTSEILAVVVIVVIVIFIIYCITDTENRHTRR